MAESPAPLGGLRVVEVASMVLVPSAAALMADLGADVIKVEPPDGDQNRHLHELPGMPRSEVQYAFLVDNRGKQGIAVDLKTPAGREILDRLLAGADVFLTNYRPAALARLRLRWEDLVPAHPRLVYASASGFGDRGPEAGKPAYDTVVYWTRSGLESTLFPVDGWLGPIPAGAGDHPSGTALFGAVMLALFARERTGRGLRVSTSLLANGLWANATTIQAELVGARFLGKRRRDEALGFGNVYYRTGDGRALKFTLVNPAKEWPNFCRAVERTDLIADLALATGEAGVARIQWLISLLDGIFAAHDAAFWRARFEAHDVPFAILPTYPELVADAARQGGFVDVDDATGPLGVVAGPITVPDAPPPRPRPAPRLGEHTAAVLADLGYSTREIDDFFARKIVR